VCVCVYETGERQRRTDYNTSSSRSCTSQSIATRSPVRTRARRNHVASDPVERRTQHRRAGERRRRVRARRHRRRFPGRAGRPGLGDRARRRGRVRPRPHWRDRGVQDQTVGRARGHDLR